MGAITVDDVIALNDEIAALVRAGVPLETGLAELGGDLPGRLGQFATALAQRTARGESLDQALADDTGQLPSAYRAVVQAGLRAGRLPAALGAVATAARRQVETQRVALIAATYPLLVILVAWCGLLLFVCALAPQFAWGYREFGVPDQGFLAALARAGRSAWLWGPIVPVAVVLLLIALWSAGRRASTLQSRWAYWFLGLVPWMARMLQWSRTATFLEVLALLVENETPLPDAVVLAAEAGGDPKTLQSARQLAARLRSGQPRPASDELAFPPLLCWLLLAADRDGALLPALQHAAAAYHRRARHQSDLLRVFLPVILTVTVGGTVTAVYALALFVPYVSMLQALGR